MVYGLVRIDAGERLGDIPYGECGSQGGAAGWDRGLGLAMVHALEHDPEPALGLRTREYGGAGRALRLRSGRVQRMMLGSQAGDPVIEEDPPPVGYVPNPEGMVLPPGEARPVAPSQLGFDQGEEFRTPTAEELARQAVEKQLCRDSLYYFVETYCLIEDQASQGWIPFRLWEKQAQALLALATHPQVILLKARQLGLSWLLVCYALWVLLHRGGSGVLLFSRRDDEAIELLERLRRVHTRLPGFLQAATGTDNFHELAFEDRGSWVRAFPTSKHSGRMYTASLAIVDEADFIQWLKRLLNAVKPTIDAGGQLVLLSTADKEKPNSAFKRLWHQAVRGDNRYHPIFLSWDARPGRDQDWYRQQARDYEQDDLFQEYPATAEEALAARTSAKRFNPKWLQSCRGSGIMAVDEDLAPGFRSCRQPRFEGAYLVAADPAEGNPNSDFSAASVFDRETWEQVAVLYGRFEPTVFAGLLVKVAEHYNQAEILWERNNHGHAVGVALDSLAYPHLYYSLEDKKPGWLSNTRNKHLAVDQTAQALRDGSLVLNDEATLAELAIFEAEGLRAPQGDRDDLAMTVVLAVVGLKSPGYRRQRGEGVSRMIPPEDWMNNLDF